jgi:hypothetical protein
MDVPNLGEMLSQFILPSHMAPSTFFGHIQKLGDALGEPWDEINYEALGLIVQPRTHGEPARFKIASGQALACLTMIQFDKRIAMNPSLQAARGFVTPDVMGSVKDGTFTVPAFNALMTALADESIATTSTSESTSPDTAFIAAGGKGFHGKGSGGKGSGGGITKFGVKTGGFSGGAGGGGGIKTGGTGNSASFGGGNKTSGGGGGTYGGGSGGAATNATRGRGPDKAAAAPRPSSLVPGDSTGVVCYARFVALLGPKMENLIACAGLLNNFFKVKVQQEAFLSDQGRLQCRHCPLQWRVPTATAVDSVW